MGALVPFAFDDALVRVIEIDGSHWWVAGDVAKILGYRTFHMVRMLDDDEQGIHNVDGLEGTRRVSREVSIISESGVFHAIFNSRRGEAERFRKWVTNEVLPALRREGDELVLRAGVAGVPSDVAPHCAISSGWLPGDKLLLSEGWADPELYCDAVELDEAIANQSIHVLA